MVFPHMLRTGKAGQVMIAEEGIHENGTVVHGHVYKPGKTNEAGQGNAPVPFQGHNVFNVKLLVIIIQRATMSAGNPNPMGPFVRKAKPHAMYAGMYSLRRKDIRATVSAKTRVVSVTALLARTIISREVAHMKAPVRAGFLQSVFL